MVQPRARRKNVVQPRARLPSSFAHTQKHGTDSWLTTAHKQSGPQGRHRPGDSEEVFLRLPGFGNSQQEEPTYFIHGKTALLG